MPNSKYVFVWENFGPQHHDRLNAVANHFGASASVVGIELSAKSGAYLWEHHINRQIEHHVLCLDDPHFFKRPIVAQIFKLIPLALRQGRAAFMLAHYEQPVIFILALVLRLFRRHVIIMNDSKFDDYDRSIMREVLKSWLYLPYHGALVASHRSASYLRFLGIRRDHIRLNYDNLSRDRVRSLVSQKPHSATLQFTDRDFVVVARLIDKKNLFRTLDAFALYRTLVTHPRKLVLVGYGPLEEKLKDHAKRLGLDGHVEFTGALPAGSVANRLQSALALLLFSTEEQFGQVVLEAQALSIPVIVSHAVGAVDCFVRNNTNGLIVDPYDVDEMAKAMAQISEDQSFWFRLSNAAETFSTKGDARHFASAIEDLMRNLK